MKSAVLNLMYSYGPIVVHFLRAFTCNRLSCIWTENLMGEINLNACSVIHVLIVIHVSCCSIADCEILEPNLSSFQTCPRAGLQWLVSAASSTLRPPSLRITGQVIRSAQNVVWLWVIGSLMSALSGGHSPARMAQRTDLVLEELKTRCLDLAISPQSSAA